MIKVLIVEDDPMVREINSKFLAKIEGFKLCLSTGSVCAARKFIDGNHPDLILLDIFLPQSNGIEFLKWLRKEEIQCDVILITADKSIEAVQEAFRYGAVDYLIKPFTFERFKEALTQYLKRKESFNSYVEIEQATIDEYIFSAKTDEKVEEESQTELIKGLNMQTYDRIWAGIVELGRKYFTAEEVAEKLGMARVTVRRYLEFMEKERKLEIELEYGKVGRPQHKYKVK